MSEKNKKIELKNVWKRYGDTIALRDVDYAINENEFFIIFGPTGAGKTTSLKIIAGLELISAGKILVSGNDVTFESPQKRNARLVFENYALYPHLTVFENIASPLRAKKMKMAEIQERVKRTADLLGIGGFLERYPRELSGGQKQRVALGRALVLESEIYLLDEPLAHLDAKIRNELRAEFHNIKSVLGNSTVIYVTHDYIEAMALGDRMVVLNKGVVEQIGKPINIYNEPINTFVATTIGLPGINLIKMSIEKSGSETILVNGEIIVKLDSRFEDVINKYDKNEIIFGIRPQYLKHSKEKPQEDGYSKFIIKSFEYKNYMYVILVQSGNIEWTILSDTFESLSQDDSIWVKPDPPNILLFDVLTEKNLLKTD